VALLSEGSNGGQLPPNLSDLTLAELVALVAAQIGNTGAILPPNSPFISADPSGRATTTVPDATLVSGSGTVGVNLGSGGALSYDAIPVGALLIGRQSNGQFFNEVIDSNTLASSGHTLSVNTGTANGVAPLDGTAKVPLANLPPISASLPVNLAVAGTNGSGTAFNVKDVAGGAAGLDGNGAFTPHDGSGITSTAPVAGYGSAQSNNVRRLSAASGADYMLADFANGGPWNLVAGGTVSTSLQFPSAEHATAAGNPTGWSAAPAALIWAALNHLTVMNNSNPGKNFRLRIPGGVYTQEAIANFPNGCNVHIVLDGDVRMQTAFDTSGSGNTGAAPVFGTISTATQNSSRVKGMRTYGPGRLILENKHTCVSDYILNTFPATVSKTASMRTVSAGDWYATSSPSGPPIIGGPGQTPWPVSSTYPGGTDAAGSNVIPFDTLPPGYATLSAAQAALVGATFYCPLYIKGGTDTISAFASATVGGWSGYLMTTASNRVRALPNPWKSSAVRASPVAAGGTVSPVFVDDLPDYTPKPFLVGAPFLYSGASAGSLIASVGITFIAAPWSNGAFYTAASFCSHAGLRWFTSAGGVAGGTGSASPPPGGSSTGATYTDGTSGVSWVCIGPVKRLDDFGNPIGGYTVLVENPNGALPITSSIAAGTVLQAPFYGVVFSTPPRYYVSRGLGFNGQDCIFERVVVEGRSGAAAYWFLGDGNRLIAPEFWNTDGQGRQVGIRIDAGMNNRVYDARGVSGDAAFQINPNGSFNKTTNLPNDLSSMDALGNEFIGGTCASLADVALAIAESVSNNNQLSQWAILTPLSGGPFPQTQALTFAGTTVPSQFVVGNEALCKFNNLQFILAGSTIASITTVGGNTQVTFYGPGDPTGALGYNPYNPKVTSVPAGTLVSATGFPPPGLMANQVRGKITGATAYSFGTSGGSIKAADGGYLLGEISDCTLDCSGQNVNQQPNGFQLWADNGAYVEARVFRNRVINPSYQALVTNGNVVSYIVDNYFDAARDTSGIANVQIGGEHYTAGINTYCAKPSAPAVQYGFLDGTNAFGLPIANSLVKGDDRSLTRVLNAQDGVPAIYFGRGTTLAFRGLTKVVPASAAGFETCCPIGYAAGITQLLIDDCDFAGPATTLSVAFVSAVSGATPPVYTLAAPGSSGDTTGLIIGVGSVNMGSGNGFTVSSALATALRKAIGVSIAANTTAAPGSQDLYPSGTAVNIA
jgi:hypothetical protein